MMSFYWELSAAAEDSILTREEAIEIALSELTSPELAGLPVEAQYGRLLNMGFRGGHPDVWRVSIDVSSLGWDMGYEGPGPMRIDGKIRYPQHVQVPKIRALIIVVDDKIRRRAMSGTEPEPGQSHRIEWR
jgi:hypothetical protein